MTIVERETLAYVLAMRHPSKTMAEANLRIIYNGDPHRITSATTIGRQYRLLLQSVETGEDCCAAMMAGNKLVVRA